MKRPCREFRGFRRHRRVFMLREIAVGGEVDAAGRRFQPRILNSAQQLLFAARRKLLFDPVKQRAAHRWHP
jgi:hypothetical protein